MDEETGVTSGSRQGRHSISEDDCDLGYSDGLNWYNYVRSDRVNNTDPSGLEPVGDEPTPPCNGSSQTTQTSAGKTETVCTPSDPTITIWAMRSVPPIGKFMGYVPLNGIYEPSLRSGLPSQTQREPLISGYVPALPCKTPYKCTGGVALPPFSQPYGGSVDGGKVAQAAIIGACGGLSWKLALRATAGAAAGTLFEPGGGTLIGLALGVLRDSATDGAGGIVKSIITQECFN